MKILSRPLRVLLARRGTFQTPLHVISVAAARDALARWELAVNMRPEEARREHGSVIDSAGNYLMQIQTERNT